MAETPELAFGPDPVPKAVAETVPPVVILLKWLGDESVFFSGIPNRDIFDTDGLSDETLDEAVANGTHERA